MLENAENSRFQLQQEKEAEDESQRKGTVYDDVFRTMIDKMPHLIIPLINQVFSKQYPDLESVTALQNEHLEVMEGKVITDSYLKIADKYYHVECQSNPDGTMAIRILASGKVRIQKGIRDMGGKVLEFEHDILMRQSEEKGEAKGVIKGERKGEARELVKNVESIMRTLKLSLEKACEVMETTVGDYMEAKLLILDQEKI